MDLIGLAREVEGRIANLDKPLKVAVMGCVVNGPGESAHADIGISLPGSGENPVAPVYMDGKRWGTLKGQDIDTEFKKLLTDYVRRTYGPKGE